MAVYLIAQIEIRDREEYGKYESGFIEIFSKYGGEILAVNEAPEVLEGQWPFTRTVVIRFDSKDEAHRWYYSPEYQALAAHRHRASAGNIVLVDGLPSG